MGKRIEAIKENMHISKKWIQIVKTWKYIENF